MAGFRESWTTVDERAPARKNIREMHTVSVVLAQTLTRGESGCAGVETAGTEQGHDLKVSIRT